ncbi:hypothetical protein EOM75_02730 [Candidatus Falkowbacteria bacterium]|nr:hypothetical protein [Bacteroidales bacterium]MDD4176909.1 hypothetical protein [Bacteroidales bacterium]MDD4740978.1 hypothetical protein [Bacteroidales bacterium]NCU34917.1 hypothetical protein [Candidatus Falkowbacteria bacterium]
MEFLLAVDLGVKTGLALFSSDGRLLWHRSQNFGNKTRLRKAIPWIVSLEENITYIVIEGGGPLLKLWDAYLEKRNIEVLHIMAEEWRRALLLSREQRKGAQAKENAVRYAGIIIQKISNQKTLVTNNNAAEAILIGTWAMEKLGWINSAAALLRD